MVKGDDPENCQDPRTGIGPLANAGILLADISLAGFTGTGGIDIELGGVRAMTEGVAYDNPFGNRKPLPAPVLRPAPAPLPKAPVEEYDEELLAGHPSGPAYRDPRGDRRPPRWRSAVPPGHAAGRLPGDGAAHRALLVDPRPPQAQLLRRGRDGRRAGQPRRGRRPLRRGRPARPPPHVDQQRRRMNPSNRAGQTLGSGQRRLLRGYGPFLARLVAFTLMVAFVPTVAREQHLTRVVLGGDGAEQSTQAGTESAAPAPGTDAGGTTVASTGATADTAAAGPGTSVRTRRRRRRRLRPRRRRYR